MQLFTLSSDNICLFKVNNRNTRKSCEICLKLAIKTLERRHTLFYCFYYWLWTSKCWLHHVLRPSLIFSFTLSLFVKRVVGWRTYYLHNLKETLYGCPQWFSWKLQFHFLTKADQSSFLSTRNIFSEKLTMLNFHHIFLHSL